MSAHTSSGAWSSGATIGRRATTSVSRITSRTAPRHTRIASGRVPGLMRPAWPQDFRQRLQRL